MRIEEAIDRLRDMIIEIHTYCDESKHISETDRQNMETFDMAIKALEQKPKTGHWRFQKREGYECVYRCSNCSRKITKYDGFYDFERLFAYCPECGAKMEGK